MINILNNEFTIDEDWCKPYFARYINANHKVAVVAFSFREGQIKNAKDLDKLYGKENGKYYPVTVSALKSYGIVEDNISILNYFEDTRETARKKIKDADIIYLTGGFPDMMFKRINEFNLAETIKEHKGIILGYSAGAMIQLSEYHITPDKDYPVFKYYEGLGILDSFGIEVHFNGSKIQNESIERFIKEKKKPVYAIGDKGALIVDNGNVRMIGDIKFCLVSTKK